MTKKAGVTVRARMTATGGMIESGGMTARAGMTVTVDGIEQHDQSIPLVDDRQEQSAEVRINLPTMKDSTAPEASLLLPAIARAAR